MHSCLKSVSRSCTAVSRSSTAIGPWQLGHCQTADSRVHQLFCGQGLVRFMSFCRPCRRWRSHSTNLLFPASLDEAVESKVSF